MPKVSVIVPCYNQAAYLDECLQSVLDQTYQDWECIIINDGSTDNTEEVAKHWEKKDARFKYIFQENKGVSAARNNGIKNAKATYILPLDGDDVLHVTAIQKFLEAFTRNDDIGVVYSKVKYFGERTDEMHLDVYNKKNILIGNSVICTALFLKEDYEQMGGYDENMVYGYEDWEFWIRFAYMINKKFFQFPEILFYYRIKKGSRNDVVMYNTEFNKIAVDYIYKKNFKFYKDAYGHPFEIIQRNKYWENWYKQISKTPGFKIAKFIKKVLGRN